MAARNILFIVGAIFLVLAFVRGGAGPWRHPQSRTWLLVGVIFVIVAV